jgi:CRP-like cAMP-binding protein
MVSLATTQQKGLCGRALRTADATLDSALARKLNTFIDLTEEERGVLADIQSKPVRIKRCSELTDEGQPCHNAYVIHSGWGCSYKILPDGSRQIIRFPIPGDCVGLPSLFQQISDHAISVLTETEVSIVKPSRLWEIFREFPRLGSAFLWAASRDEAMVIEHLASIGRRSALERTAYFFLELAERLALVGLGTETQLNCPLNQYDVGDALGLSAIHVNRVLRQLREHDLLSVRSGKVTIHNIDNLRKLAGYHSVNAVGKHQAH